MPVRCARWPARASISAATRRAAPPASTPSRTRITVATAVSSAPRAAAPSACARGASAVASRGAAPDILVLSAATRGRLALLRDLMTAGGRRLLQDRHAGRLRLGLLGALLPLQAPGDRALARLAHEGQEVRTVEKDSRILFGGGSSTSRSRRTSTSSRARTSSTAWYDLYFRGSPARRELQGDALRALGAASPRSSSSRTTRSSTRRDLDDARRGRDGALLPARRRRRHHPQHARPDNASYNATFTYPEGGAIQYVHALLAASAGAHRAAASASWRSIS
jgi:hypothetical protein